MRVTIKFDTLETEYPNMIAEAARNLMLASRGMTVNETVSADAETQTDYEIDTSDNVAVMTSPRSDAVEVAAPRKRGRKSNAEKAAEAAAETVTETVTEPATETVVVPDEPAPVVPSTPAPPMFQASPVAAPVAAPVPTNPVPAFTPPAAPTPTATAPTFTPPPAAVVQPQAPAMPSPGPAPVGHTFTVDDLKTIISTANTMKDGAAFQIMRRAQWADGSPKASWAIVDQVPADMYERLGGEIC